MTEARSRAFDHWDTVTSYAVRIRVLSATIVCLLLASGCASDGQVLRPPSPNQTTTSRPAPVTTPPDLIETDSGLKISSPDFEPGDAAPKDMTCEGSNTPPTLTWDGPLPQGAQELAISLTNQTNPDEPLLLWLVAGIPTSANQINSGLLPEEAVETLNDYGQSGFGDPCIELTSDDKDLQFRLHALSARSGIEADSPGNESFDQIASLSIDSTAVLVTLGSSAVITAETN